MSIIYLSDIITVFLMLTHNFITMAPFLKTLHTKPQTMETVTNIFQKQHFQNYVTL